MFVPALVLVCLILEFGIPILAAQRWGLLGFLRANVWIMIAVTLAYSVMPQIAATQLLWFLTPLSGVLIVFLFALGHVFHLAHMSPRIMIFLMMMGPQILYTLIGGLLGLAFRRTSPVHEQSTPQ